jgi:hypothetical protein
MDRYLAVVVLALALPAIVRAEGLVSSAYFPLRVGNWWVYEEQDAAGNALSRETWTVVEADARSRAGEYLLRSLTKRLDALGHRRHRFEGHEYLRAAPDGLRKRYPAGLDAELEVLLVKEPPSAGLTWRDAQGRCTVTGEREPCAGPDGPLAGCLVIVCTLGEPPLTIVTSTYAREIGMVRQDVDVLQLLPGNGPAALLPSEARGDGHSVLRLIRFNVGRR